MKTEKHYFKRPNNMSDQNLIVKDQIFTYTFYPILTIGSCYSKLEGSTKFLVINFSGRSDPNTAIVCRQKPRKEQKPNHRYNLLAEIFFTSVDTVCFAEYSLLVRGILFLSIVSNS